MTDVAALRIRANSENGKQRNNDFYDAAVTSRGRGSSYLEAIVEWIEETARHFKYVSR
jgi:hypothetical protein